MEALNIYCDESCHLEHDGCPIMALGAVWCRQLEHKNISQRIMDIKNKHAAKGELKWTKVSNSRKEFYLDLVDWFFKEPYLNFRAVIVLDKSKLDHQCFNKNSHNTFYYKIYFTLLNKVLIPENKYNIYVDVKDTQSRLMNQKLKEILCNNARDFTGEMIEKIQNIHSKESHLMQLTDFLLGALTYKHRNLFTNSAKLEIINQIESHLKQPITKSTPMKQKKFNLFLFAPRQGF